MEKEVAELKALQAKVNAVLAAAAASSDEENKAWADKGTRWFVFMIADSLRIAAEPKAEYFHAPVFPEYVRDDLLAEMWQKGATNADIVKSRVPVIRSKLNVFTMLASLTFSEADLL